MCFERRPPPTPAKSGPAPATSFNERLQIDVTHIALKDVPSGKAMILHVVDTATRFGMARVIEKEQGPDIAQALERLWIRPFGIPSKICMDEGRANCSQELIRWMEKHNIRLDVAPG